MSAEHKINKAIQSCLRALETRKENKRLSIKDLDFAKDHIEAALYLTIAEIEKEGENWKVKKRVLKTQP